MKYWYAGLLLTSLAGPTLAGELDDLLRQVQQAKHQSSRIDEERKARFLADRNEQQKLLSETRAALAKAEADSKALRAEFSANGAQLGELAAELKKQTGELGDLYGAVREFAGALRTDLDNSLTSAQFPGRTQALETFAKSKELPNMAQLESLWLSVLQEMTESGKVSQFKGQVTNAAGETRTAEIYRIGAFSALADGNYVRYAPETGQLVDLPRQPDREYLALAKNLQAHPGQLVKVAIDPARGAVLDLAMRIPTATERVRQGGAIGYIIILLGLVGAVMVLTRLWILRGIGRKIREQLADMTTFHGDNPLGRVLAAAGEAPGSSVEALELRLDEAILRETPVLERGQALIKLLIAVAPLLGLLGTVTGMIQVFQSITLHGSSDPRLMAGGIAEALVTTMLGLEVAIPLSFLYSLLVARSRTLVNILDEQSAGLLCQNIEARRA